MLCARTPLVGLAVVLAGCSISVHRFAAPTEYSRTWTAVWGPIVAAVVPYAPTESSPGVCNKGATKQECGDADQALIPLLTKAVSTLGSVTVASGLQAANAATITAVNTEIAGLTQRDDALFRVDQTTFAQSQTTLANAHAQVAAAYAQFPIDSRPNPVPPI